MSEEPLTPDDLRGLISAAARLLPAQGPISSFVALNPLHGFEDRPFEVAVEEAARLMHAQPYLEESVYRQALAEGRITPADIDAVLAEDLGAEAATLLAGGRVRLLDVQRLLLVKGLKHESDTAVRWTLTETDATERLRPDLDPACRDRLVTDAGKQDPGDGRASAAEQRAARDLWHACVEATAGSRAALVHRRPPARPRDLVVAVRPDLDPDLLVHPPLIRLVSAYLDQGVADWTMPDRSRGLLAAVAEVAGRFGPQERWADGLRSRFAEIAARCRDRPGSTEVASEVIAEELAALGVTARDRGEVIAASLVALRGWAGMVWQLEQRPDLAPCIRLPARLADFLAVRLVFDRVAAGWTAGRLVGTRATGPQGVPPLAAIWTELRDRFPPQRGPGTVSRAFLLHQLAQLLGLTAADLRDLDPAEIIALERSISAFDSFTRRRLLHLAYERRFNTTLLDALSALPPEPVAVAPPRRGAQLFFCIDDRCESLRRHLEETDPAVETFGAAGFFAVPMNYRGLDDWHATPLCPIVIRPGHTVTEEPAAEHLPRHRARQRARRWSGRVRERLFSGSRTLFVGGLLTSIGGAIAAVPLVSRVIAPRLTTLVNARVGGRGRRRIRTRLDLFRTAAGSLPDGTLSGFTPDEMAGIVRRLLEDIGLTGSFARLVVLLGHGSTSLNNPHESAYDCGACGGGRGGPNARAFALMANDPAVRALLAAAGLAIPADTVFVGGMQDTCSSGIEWFDADRLPATHRDEFRSLVRSCDAARALDAQERCRRFDSVPPSITPAEALRAVEARAGDLAQVRPEYGHATTAACIVGRRKRTSELFLDRRAFLASYDPDADPDDEILGRTLAAVVPVCSGISLAYAFSRIDPLVYGAGTKLPHNITGLIGVMDGHASDLRTGLPLQGVEIHEPVRLMLVVETTPERLRRVVAALPGVERLVRNGWVHLTCWPPPGTLPQVYDRRLDRFVPHRVESSRLPRVARSHDWYAAARGNLPPALIRPGEPEGEVAA